MSKVKTLPTAQPDSQGFMAALGKLAQPFIKPDVPSDPVERMRAKFAVHVDATIKAIGEGAEKGKWFRKHQDGSFVLSFRNANSALTLNGAKQFQVADAEAASKLLEAAKTAAAAGELDDALKATQRKPPVRKKKEAETA
jgi:hypothetical protein